MTVRELEFDYSVWNPDTVIDLVQVPWDSSYRDLVRFDSLTERENWFARKRQQGRAVQLTGLVYLKYGEPVRLPLPFSQCNQFNYLIARNPVQPVPSRSDVPDRVPDTFYYFVTDVQYGAPNCTLLTVQLDVWQTYYPRLAFGRSYITRGHVAVANQNSTIDNLADYLTEPEGIEYGAEYEVTHQQFMNLAEGSIADPPWIFIMSNTKLDAGWGSVDNPKLETADGSVVNGMKAGAQCWVMPISHLENFMDVISLTPWVSQGIMLMTVIPHEMVSVSDTPSHPGGHENIDMYPLSAKAPQGTIVNIEDFWTNFKIPARYADYLKLYTSPYCVLEVTALQANPVVYKPECMQVTGGVATFRRQYCAVPPNQRVAMWPLGYNGRQSSTTYSMDGAGNMFNASLDAGDAQDIAVTLTNFPQMSIVNNMYQSYLASTVHGRQFQQQNATWAQQKSLAAANNAYNVAMHGNVNALQNQGVSNELSMLQLGINRQQNAWSGTKNVVGGLAGGVASGNLAGLAAGGAQAAVAGMDAALQDQWMQQSTGNQIAAANKTLANNMGYSAYVADTNYSYASYAANGDYQQAIQGINAQVQDAALTQPTVSGQIGGEAFNWCTGRVGFLVKWKRIKTQYINQVGDYLMRYGYYCNRFLVPPADLKCMTKFTYWQMQDAIVYGNLPEAFRQAIRGIFESGCTVWTNPDEIGRIDYVQNKPVQGVRY